MRRCVGRDFFVVNKKQVVVEGRGGLQSGQFAWSCGECGRRTRQSISRKRESLIFAKLHNSYSIFANRNFRTKHSRFYQRLVETGSSQLSNRIFIWDIGFINSVVGTLWNNMLRTWWRLCTWFWCDSCMGELRLFEESWLFSCHLERSVSSLLLQVPEVGIIWVKYRDHCNK